MILIEALALYIKIKQHTMLLSIKDLFYGLKNATSTNSNVDRRYRSDNILIQ